MSVHFKLTAAPHSDPKGATQRKEGGEGGPIVLSPPSISSFPFCQDGDPHPLLGHLSPSIQRCGVLLNQEQLRLHSVPADLVLLIEGPELTFKSCVYLPCDASNAVLTGGQCSQTGSNPIFEC